MRIPPPSAPADRDNGIVREWRIIEALDGTDVPHTEAIAVCTDPSVLGRTFYLMGFVDGWSPMATGDPLAGAVRHRPRGAARARLRAGRGHRPAVEGRLAGEGSAGPRATRRIPRAPGRPLDGVLRADQGPRAARLRRGGGVAPRPPADRLHPGADARRLPVRQRDVPTTARRPGWPPSSTGRWARSATRSSTWRGWCTTGRRTPTPRRRSRLRRPHRHADARRAARALRREVRPPGRRHRLLLRAGQVEAGDRARAGLPARRRRPTLQAFGPIVLDLMREAAELAETSDYKG